MAKEQTADRAEGEAAFTRAQLECNAAISQATGQLIIALVEVQNAAGNALTLLIRGEGESAQRAAIDFGAAGARLTAAQVAYAAAMQSVGEALLQAGGLPSSKLN